jgi:hypothetical protein
LSNDRQRRGLAPGRDSCTAASLLRPRYRRPRSSRASEHSEKFPPPHVRPSLSRQDHAPQTSVDRAGNELRHCNMKCALMSQLGPKAEVLSLKAISTLAGTADIVRRDCKARRRTAPSIYAKKLLVVADQADLRCPVLTEKFSRFARRANLPQSARLILPPNQRQIPHYPVPLKRGVCAIVTDVGCGMRWTRACQRRMTLIRGRRSRVVLTPRRWRQVCERQLSQATVARKPGHRGERDISRKTIARGMPGDSGVTVVTTLVCYLHTAHEAAGASSARHSLRPLF